MKFIRAFKETWAPVLFFAAFLGFIGLGISHVDAKVRAEEAKALVDGRSGCPEKFLTDQEALCSRGAVRFDRVGLGSLRSHFTNSH